MCWFHPIAFPQVGHQSTPDTWLKVSIANNSVALVLNYYMYACGADKRVVPDEENTATYLHVSHKLLILFSLSYSYSIKTIWQFFVWDYGCGGKHEDTVRLLNTQLYMSQCSQQQSFCYCRWQQLRDILLESGEASTFPLTLSVFPR